MKLRCLGAALALVLGCTMVLAPDARADGCNFSIADATKFTMSFTDDTGATVTITEADANGPRGRCWCFGHRAWLYKVDLGTTGRDVWVKLYGTRSGSLNGVMYFFPQGIPTGWRTNWIQRHFTVGQETPAAATDLRVIFPKVFGPTFRSAAVAQQGMELYPTFLQTQQVTLENTATGDCLTMITEDDRARRKEMGFATDGAGGVEFMFRWIPEQDFPTDPNPYGWWSPYYARFAAVEGGFGEAIDYYRREQLFRPGSFLRSRLPVASKAHPKLREAKYVMAIGTSLGPVVLPNGQFDLSPAYRAALLNTFGTIHGNGMLFYHLGWFAETPGVGATYPDAYGTILPGHAALLAESAALDKDFASVGYTLPGVVSVGSTNFSPDVVVLDADGQEDTIVLPGNSSVYRRLSFWPEDSTDLLAPQYVDLVRNKGFAGAYMDAITAAPISYTFASQNHPRRFNEQQLGIERLVSTIKTDLQNNDNIRPILVNETPTDSLPLDGSALDTYTFDPSLRNVFRMTYTGLEWYYFSLVWAIDDRTGLFGPSIYTFLLGNALASGARPLVLWPEFAGVIPTDPLTDPAYLPFISLLASYSANYDSFWRQIIEGRTYDQLSPFDVVAGTVTLPTPAPSVQDLLADKHRLPGWKPRNGLPGCTPPYLAGGTCCPIFHGVFQPSDNPNRRCVVLCRWTDPQIATARNAPANHWMHKQNESVSLKLCRRNVKCSGGNGNVSLYCPDTQTYQPLGTLSNDPDVKTTFTVTFNGGCGTKVICID